MNGAIIINKEKNMTSRDVVNRLNQILKTKELGHTGTLDPMATGVLVCLTGKFTKLTNILTNHDKEYIASFKLGLLTDTLDITGKILKEEKYIIDKNEIFNGLKEYVKTYSQEVPLYSAVKINGKKLYEYARNNEEIILPKREVTIYSIELLSINNDIITIKTKVSKGTYIRSLIRDIGLSLKTYATMTSLERTKVGDFDISKANSLDDVFNNKYHLFTIEELLNPKIEEIKEKDLIHIKNGNVISNDKDKYLLYKFNNENIALYERFNDKEIKPLIMF